MSEILRIQNLSKSFGGLQAVNHVTCGFPAGQITSVIGPNGAGKTTLFNLVTGFLRADEGRVLLEGKDITRLPPHRIAKLGMKRTFQLVRVFPRLTLVENILMGYTVLPGDKMFSSILGGKRIKADYRAHEKAAREMVDYIGLSEYADKPANDLSYGQQKLVELGRALVSEPKILLIDEPLSGLNVSIIEKMLKLIDQIKAQGKTIIIIEHNTEIIKRISDRIIVLNFGEVIANDTPEKVCADKSVIDSYLGIG